MSVEMIIITCTCCQNRVRMNEGAYRVGISCPHCQARLQSGEAQITYATPVTTKGALGLQQQLEAQMKQLVQLRQERVNLPERLQYLQTRARDLDIDNHRMQREIEARGGSSRQIEADQARLAQLKQQVEEAKRRNATLLKQTKGQYTEMIDRVEGVVKQRINLATAKVDEECDVEERTQKEQLGVAQQEAQKLRRKLEAGKRLLGALQNESESLNSRLQELQELQELR